MATDFVLCTPKWHGAFLRTWNETVDDINKRWEKVKMFDDTNTEWSDDTVGELRRLWESMYCRPRIEDLSKRLSISVEDFE